MIDVPPIVSEDHLAIEADEFNRISSAAHNPLLTLVEEGEVRRDGRIIPYPKMRFMLATMNPAEVRENVVPINAAMASRFVIGSVLGFETTDESRERLFANDLPELSSVNPALTLRQADIIRGVAQIVRSSTSPEIRKKAVAGVKAAEAGIRDQIRYTERTRLDVQVGRTASVLAVLSGSDTVRPEHLAAAIRFGVAARVGAKTRDIEKAPQHIREIHERVLEAIAA
jgi:MoxR-like ATPase